MKNIIEYFTHFLFLIIASNLIYSCSDNPTDSNNYTPRMITTDVTTITETTAVCGGTVTDDGGAIVTSRGVCWSQHQEPTVADNKTSDGSGVSSFTSFISGLTDGTLYYYRAYAINNVGAGYGSTKSFTTVDALQAPVLSTLSVSAIAHISAQCGGTITENGGAIITARGVCWSKNHVPTITDSKTSDGTGMGSFTSSIIGLSANTTYNIRAYATNAIGTGYGNNISFTTEAFETGTVTDIDGNIYQTIKIGDQWWMAENLKVTHYRNGETIPNVTDSAAWANLSSGAYCEYNNDERNVATFGRLYNWYVIADGRNIAPTGWHVPTDNEWKQLEIYLGMSKIEADLTGYRGNDEGDKLKGGKNNWSVPNSEVTNESGFSAVAAGFRRYQGNYLYLHTYAYFWSSSEGINDHIWSRYLGSYYSTIGRRNYYKQSGFSVRCIKD